MKLVKLFFMAKSNVVQLVSSYKNANTFIIEINDFDILIIDLGNYPTGELVNWMKTNNKNLIGLFLTHEHADHCFGVDALKELIDFTLYCSEKCEVNMRNPKENFSRYIEEFETFGVQSEATIIKEGQIISFDGFKVSILETPGHSPGSICLILNDIIFTGDTLLNGVVSPLSFPHSNKMDYQESKKKIFGLLTNQFKIYPGHGEPFNIESNNDWN